MTNDPTPNGSPEQVRAFVAFPISGGPPAFVDPWTVVGFHANPDARDIGVRSIILTPAGPIPTSAELGTILGTLTAVTGVRHVFAEASPRSKRDEDADDGDRIRLAE